MIISNHKTVYKTVSEKHHIDPLLVEQVGQFVWDDLNKRISGFENREIYMLKLGVFKFRKVKGEHYLRQLKKSLAMINQNPKLSEFEKEDYSLIVMNKISSMEALVEEWNEIIKEREEFKNEQANRHIQE